MLCYLFFGLVVWLTFPCDLVLTQSLPENSPQLTIRRFQFQGNSLISDQQLQKLAEPYLQKNYSLTELNTVIQTLVEKINLQYQSRGFIFSGAYAPPSDYSNGEILIVIKEQGKLEGIQIDGLQRVPESYVRSRINFFIEEPFNIKDLELALNRLRFDPLFKEVRGNLERTMDTKTAKLDITVVEAPAHSLEGTYNNYEAFRVGQTQFRSHFTSLNLLGFADRVSLQYDLTEGLDKLNVNYTLPISGSGTTINLGYEEGNSRIIEPPLERFDIEGKTKKARLKLEQPLYIDQNNEISGFLGLEWQQNESSLLNLSFSFIPEVPEAQTRWTALHFGQQWVNRSFNQVIAFRSEFTFGIDALNATILDNPSGIDGIYSLWRGQFQFIRSLTPDFFVRFNVSGQITSDALLPGERFQIGGFYTVRGFEQNLRTGDNGYTVRVEFPYTPLREPDSGDLTLTPFWDLGFVDNNKFESIYPDTLSSVGISLVYDRTPLRLRFDYANTLTKGTRPQNWLFELNLVIQF